MPGMLGKKLGMTNIYSEDGRAFPVTVLEVGPCNVVAIKTKERDGYEALQLGFGMKKEKHLSKPQIENYKKLKLKPSAYLREFRNFDISEYKIGDVITADVFEENDVVKVSAKSKGKGFQGVMKRHGFAGGQRTHGQGDRERAPGSIGQSSYPSRVFKGMKMGGRTGHKRITTTGLKVVKVINEKNLVLVKGSVPGAINTIVEIKK
ncbi:LSU ribosomal protein L3p (L3e) [hydrothermal vent metagenome]|uniref:LSU ribosomal protein L3p (L3e) n=1 Tax=hydrothermal vent metagenome TaxID=652676 RepID=A0A3B1D4K4_9ZZZZ